MARYDKDIFENQIHGKADIKTGTGATSATFVVGGTNAISASFVYGDGSNLSNVGGTLKHVIAIDQIIRFAHSGDNSVIVELPDVKIPAKAIITRVSAMVYQESTLSTHEVSVQMSATTGTSADSTISSGTELLGAGVANTVSTDSRSATDISLGSSAGDLKDVWLCNDTVRNGTSDQYIYICNAGAGNGTTNSTRGELSVVIEYYGMD